MIARTRRLVKPALFLLLMFAYTACATGNRQSTLDPEGPIARTQDNIFRPVFYIAWAVFFLVEGLIVFALIKFRDRGDAEEPKQIHGNSRLELTWTLIPALLLFGISIPTVATIMKLAEPPAKDALRVTVIGHQWWWEYTYDGTKLVTANELVIPTNREVFINLESVDVIHSFWVPRLAGKQDVVPGRTNNLRIQADKPGIYYGQCAEFCALSHANMKLRVIAKSPADYKQWEADQLKPATAPTTGDAAAGLALFQNQQLLGSDVCIQCHAINGIEGATGALGPNLTHFATRGSFAGSMFDNDVATGGKNVHNWIKFSQDLKAGVIMPMFKDRLTDKQINQIVAFLATLK